MFSKTHESLTDTQVAHFEARGFVVMQACFSPDRAESLRRDMLSRIGLDFDSPGNWTGCSTTISGDAGVVVRKFAPTVWGAICELVGGPERIANPDLRWNRSCEVVFPGREREPWNPPDPAAAGWECAGGLCGKGPGMPELSLITIVLWSDVVLRSGGLLVPPDSMGPVARFLNARPGDESVEVSCGNLVRDCDEYIELTGRAGDVILCHPYLLLNGSQNATETPTILEKSCVSLKPTPDTGSIVLRGKSPLERAIARHLT